MNDNYEFEEIRDSYLDLQDNDFPTAYGIMVASANLIETYETMVAEANKNANVLKSVAEAVEAKIAVRLSSEHSVSKAEKMAKCSDEVKVSKDAYFTAKEIAEGLQGKVNFLNRVYYDTKAVWEKGNRGYREARA